MSFSIAFHLIPERQGILLDLTPAVSVRLAGQRSPWLLRSLPLNPEVAGWCGVAECFYVGAGDSNLGPHACTASALTQGAISPGFFGHICSGVTLPL